ALLPQFVHPERGAVLLQFVTLGLIVSLVGTFFGSLLALAASRVSAWLRRRPSRAGREGSRALYTSRSERVWRWRSVDGSRGREQGLQASAILLDKLICQCQPGGHDRRRSHSRSGGRSRGPGPDPKPAVGCAEDARVCSRPGFAHGASAPEGELPLARA